MRRIEAWLAGAALAAVLAGCGGGGGGIASGGSTAPTPTPTPSYATIDAISGQTLATRGALLATDRPTGSPTESATVGAAPIEIRYDGATQTYLVRGIVDPGGATVEQQFGPGDRDAATGSYERIETTAGGDTNFRRLSVGAGAVTRNGAAVPLTYTGWGRWQSGTTSRAGGQEAGTTYFSYGLQTQAGDLPRTGSASYTLALTGGASSTPVTGDGSLTADFASATVSATLRPGYVYRPNQVVTPFATLTGSGSLNSSDRSFATALAGDGYTGALEGLFYGPQGGEVGGAFRIEGGNPVAGAFVGKRD